MNIEYGSGAKEGINMGTLCIFFPLHTSPPRGSMVVQWEFSIYAKNEPA